MTRPQSRGFRADLGGGIQGQAAGTDGVSRLQVLMPTAAFADGFLAGAPGLQPVE